MRRETIHQFRAALAGRTEPGPLVRAYRELARRPGLAAGAGFAAWGDWAGPPVAGAK
ncbi:MAG TPA: hypothetical protein VEX86_05560 [Longimicrobium sp.]|nr:hypothetical protein [Longimicrobium sp.]